MRITPLPLLTLSVLLLAGCQTTSLTEEQQAPVPDSQTPFSGELREVDRTQSVIAFTGKSNIITHEGQFNEYDADVTLDSENPADLEKATISANVDITSAVTDAEGLNRHLQQEEFFDAATYPTATFVSTEISALGGNNYQITGDLTVKGTTKSVSFPAEITDDYLTASFDFPRKDFGIGNDSYGQKLLEPMVPVVVKLVFVR